MSTGTNDMIEQPLTVTEQIRTLGQLPRDVALVKIENDTMQSLAAAHPRSYDDVLADIKQQLGTFKTFAASAMYCKPVGKDETGKMLYARGLSIRAAEAIAAACGYNRVRTDVTNLDDNRVEIVATFTDFQRGRIWQKAGILSKTYRARGGGLRRHDEDRFYNVVVKAEESRLIRECILRCVPPGLRSELELCVDKQVNSFLDDGTAKKIVAQFSTKRITQAQLETHMGKRLENFTREDRQILLGLWNAIEQGETSIAELFPDESQPEQAEPAQGSAAVARRARAQKPGAARRAIETASPPKQGSAGAAESAIPPIAEPPAERTDARPLRCPKCKTGQTWNLEVSGDSCPQCGAPGVFVEEC